MDFYKSRNSNSTSSNHSNSNSSHKSHASSNGGATYNLEYCTSSSSLSPFSTATSSCHRQSSAAQTVVSVAIDEVIIPPSTSGGAVAFSSSRKSSVSSTTSSLCSSQNTIVKRKRRRSSISLDNDKDPELCFEPSAKRQQRLPSLYERDAGSVVSSVYPSPVDELVHEIDTHSSSDCLSTASGFDVPTDDIPESPNSLLHAEEECLPDDDDDSDDDHDNRAVDDDTDDADDDDDEVISGTSSPSTCSVASSKASIACEPSALQLAAHNTHSLSQSGPHHGERTPGQRYGGSSHADGQQRKVKTFDDYVSSHYDCMTPAADPEPLRQCPLPALSWANAHDVWQLMCKKDEQAACLRDPCMLEQHPGLQPRMRAILLDWLIEVCEVYKLHRETYYLAVDYLDRYLSTQKKVQKTHLQLIGITCLFVAAKVEEIYPPKIGEFAYVTDGACQEADILQHEILLLQALEWSISPVTPMGWLGVYMQLNVNNRTPASLKNANRAATSADRKAKSSATSTANADDAFIYPQFSGLQFVQTAQLLDLCSLDVGIASFPYSVLAAAAISHTFNRETALRCSGLDWQTIQPCARWMQSFFQVVCEQANFLHLIEQNEQITTKFGLGHICPNIVTDDSHIIQTHTTTLAMFDRACQEQEKLLAIAMKIQQEASPATGLMCPEGLLTPPASSRKPPGVDDDDQHRRVMTCGTFVAPATAKADVENHESNRLVVSTATTTSRGVHE